MKTPNDRFSRQANLYKKFRPTYPKAVYDCFLPLVKNKRRCWDCGTGNGQVAIQLASYFESVFATDISQNQLSHAETRENITYKIERAEETSFPDDFFELITVAQAIHWFDFEAFNQEIRRVSVNGGIVAVWGYGLLRVQPDIDLLLDHFYWDTVGSQWNKERRHINDEYRSIPLRFKELPAPENLSIQTTWTLHQLQGYLNSWSSVQNYLQEYPDSDPVQELIDEIGRYWPIEEEKAICFPIFMRIGEIKK
jgi:ubiquinone/menaquinone biosynthesis C-methylase UbiE